jgi:hypothetical protein
MPRDLPRFRDQIQSSSRQDRHVQDLADRANAIRPAAVLVDENAAASEIQQSNAA